jgi:hypothetical protein
MMIDDLASFIEADVFVAALEQLGSDRFLQRLNVLTDRRLGHVQLCRGSGKILPVCHCDEDSQLLIHDKPPRIDLLSIIHIYLS